MTTPGARLSAGELVHAQTRKGRTTVLFLLGVGVFAVAAGTPYLQRALSAEALGLRVFAALYALILTGAWATHRVFGVWHPLYLAFNWGETALLTVGVGVLITLGGTAANLLWLLYLATVVHGARAALFPRYNAAVFGATPVLVASGFALQGRASDALLTLGVGVAVLYLYSVFLAASRRQVTLEVERDGLRERLREAAVAEERLRIARELHDGLGARLNATIWQLRRDAGPASAAAEQRLMGAMDELGALVWTVRREASDTHSFWLQARTRCDDLFGPEVHIDYALPTDEPGQRLDDGVAATALGILFEALRNCVRHAGAKRVTVKGELSGGDLVLTVTDDGKGFDASVESSGHGLKHLRERAQRAGGRLELESQPGRTLVRATLPCAPASE